MTRGELFELIWSKTIVKVAMELNVSDSWVIKLCKLYEIPRPPSGYWNKLAAGKPVCLKPALPGTAEDAVHVKSSDFAEYGGGGRSRKALSGSKGHLTVAGQAQDEPSTDERPALAPAQAPSPTENGSLSGRGNTPASKSPAYLVSNCPMDLRATIFDDALRWQRQQALVEFTDRMVEAAGLLPEQDRQKVDEWVRKTLERLRQVDPLRSVLARILQS